MEGESMKTRRICYIALPLLFVAAFLAGCSVFGNILKAAVHAAVTTQPAPTPKQTLPSSTPKAASPETEGKALTTGRFIGHRYTNEFFGITLDVPEDWYIASRDQIATKFGVGKESVGADDRQEESSLGLERQRNLYCFDISMYPNDFTNDILLLCDNLEITSNYVDAKTYARQSLDYMDASDIPHQISSIGMTDIDGREFATFDVSFDFGSRTVYQAIYCTVQGNYALSFIMTSDSSDDLAIALYHALINGVRFH
jgi:hypothetical protein